MKRRLHLPKRCKTTGKRRYRSRLDALIDTANAAAYRAYRCEFCDSWHTTSHPQRRRSAPDG